MHTNSSAGPVFRGELVERSNSTNNNNNERTSY